MIAVAKGLLGGLETAVASAAKKDGNTPPFADTFQQVSANQNDQVTKAVTQRWVKADRAFSSGKKASGASVVNSAKQTVDVSKGGSVSAAKSDGTTLVAGAGSAIDGDVENGSEQVEPLVAGKKNEIADGAAAKGNVDVKSLEGTALPNAAQPLVNSLVEQSSDGIAVVSALQEKGLALQPVVIVSDEGTTKLLSEGKTPETIQRTGSPYMMKQIPLDDDPTIAVAPAATLPSESKVVPSEVFVSSSTDSSQVREQVSVSVLVAAQDAATSGKTSATGSAREVQFATSASGSSVDLAGSVPVRLTAGSLQTLVPSHSTPSNGTTPIKTAVADDSDEEPKGQALNVAALASTGNADASVLAVGPAGVNGTGQPTGEVVPASLDSDSKTTVPAQFETKVNGSSSPAGPVGAASNGRTFQKTEISTNAEVSGTMGKAKSKQADGTQAKVADAAPEAVVTPMDAIMNNSLAAGAVVSTFAGSAANIPASHEIAPNVLDASSAASSPMPVSSGLQDKLTSATGISLGVKGAVFPGNTAGIATPQATGNALALKAAKASVSPVAGSEEQESAGAQGDVSETSAAVQVATGSTPGIPGSGELMSKDAVVAAANSLVKSGQQRGIAGGNASVAKERKGSVAETKPPTSSASSTAIEGAAGGASIVASGAGSTSAKSASGEHQALAVTSAQPTAASVGNVESAGLSSSSQGISIAGTVAATASPVASASGNADVSSVGTNDTNTTAPTILQGADHGISPMPHTTLSATPTVLEVGVPGGTQGWLKIRAEIGEGGVVQASMSASTHAGQDALRRDLPAISAFLDSEHVPVNLQVTHSTSASIAGLVDTNGLLKDGGFNPGSNLGQSLNQNANSSAGSGQGEAASGMLAGGSGGGQNGGQQQPTTGSTADAGSGSASARTVAGVVEADWVTPAGYGTGASGSGGSWLNVIA